MESIIGAKLSPSPLISCERERTKVAIEFCLYYNRSLLFKRLSRKDDCIMHVLIGLTARVYEIAKNKLEFNIVLLSMDGFWALQARIS